MYICGASMVEVAKTLGVSKSTIRSWCVYDRKRGISWHRLRARMGNLSPEEALQMLRRRLARMVADGGTTGPDDPRERKEHETSLLTMTKIIKGFEKSADQLTCILSSLEEFAGYCADNLSREDLAAVRRAVEGFTDKLERDNP